MDFPSVALLFTTLLVRLAVAQESGWQLPGQVNATMCQWQNPRAAVVRDTLYIDGGVLWWTPGWDDGTYHPPTNDGNPLGLVYVLNFSTPFNTSQNISTIFSSISKASNGGSANNIGPQYVNGGMFANDYEWFIYGGMYQLTDEYSAPAAGSVAAYEVYASGPPKQFQPGFILETLPSSVTRYITDGASASAPSENLGFYFSGLRSASFGEIYYLPGNESQNADVESATLIQLDMSVQQKEVWTNYSLPSSVTPRANAEIVWVPVSEKGILVAIGGVINPEFANINQSVSAAAGAESENISPTFMSSVSIYDIDTQTWYEQRTSDSGPTALTQGCTVLASADDGSSHNIYWYGGFDGINATGSYSDDVWILSIPTFMWMKVYSGSASHGRAGHRCAKPYPDQMFVVGGYPSSPGEDLNCLEGFIQIFNLSSAVWLDEYNPDVWSNYSVPSMIYAMIGGSGTGSATQSAPTPTGFSNSSVADIFATPYAISKITTYYPYSAIETNTTTPRSTITATHGGSGTPKYLAPLLGVVLGLFFITIVILTILLWRRRRLLRSRRGTSEAGTDSQNYRILNWVRGTGEKAPTVTTDETPSSPYTGDDTSHPDVQEQNQLISEAGGDMVHEMMDTSKPVEMDTHPTGFVPFGPKTRPYSTSDSDRGSKSGLQISPSVTSNTSRSSKDSRPAISPVHSPGAVPRADSPTMIGAARDRDRVVSNISSVSDDDHGHLRGISETSVSTIGDAGYVTPLEQGSEISANLGPRPQPAAYGEGGLRRNEGREGAISPLTPPEGVEEKSEKEGGDYVGQGRVDSDRSGTPTSAKFNKRSSFQERL